MSAPIPVFKIRCVFFIICLFIAFMLLGLTRRAFAVDCNLYDLSVSYYTTSAARQSAYNASSFPNSSSYISADGLYVHDCLNITDGLNVIVKWKSQLIGGLWYYTGSAFVLDASCVDGSDADGQCECHAEKQDLSQQCGSTGYTMVDEDTCEGRCNDCVQEAEEQCTEPNIIVWNDDGECSYNCSPDTDGDGTPDVEDPDDDDDGKPDYDDPCPTNSDPACVKPLGPDTDGDGTPDVSDPDADMDGDGKKNSEDDDDDGDGVPDNRDLDADPDGDGKLNWEDDDDDGDGTPDIKDPDADPDYDGIPNSEDDDDDGDGVPDIEDPDNDQYTSNQSAYTWLSDIGQQFSNRFKDFIDDMKGSSIFSIPGQIFGSGSIPTGGSPTIEYNGGTYYGGRQTIDISNWSSGLAAIRAALYAIFAAVAIKIAAIGH